MLNKGYIDIESYLKEFEPMKFKDDKLESLNVVENRIICTEEVFKNLNLKKVNDKIKLDFNDIIDIKSREDFSYQIVKKYWGASLENEIVDYGIDEDGLYIIFFNTRYLPPLGIIKHLLKKYKENIIWLYKPYDFLDREKNRLCYYKENQVEVLIEKDLAKEEIEDEENMKFSIGFFLPYHAVYNGEYVNAYAKDNKSPKFICSCQKKAIENKLMMFEEYLKYDYCLNDRKELLLRFLGLPQHYEKLIKEKPLFHKYIDYMKLFEFEDDLCYICNRIKIPDQSIYLKNGVSKFRQRYRAEIEKQYSIAGIVNPVHVYNGNYFSQKLLSEENREKLCISDSEILEKLKEYNLNININEEWKKFKKLSIQEQDAIKYSLDYNSNGSFSLFKLVNEKLLNLDFIYSIQDIFDQRMKEIRKDINNSIQKFDKIAMDYKTLIDLDYGLNLILKKGNNFLHINLFLDVIEIEDIQDAKKIVNYTCESNLELLSKIMEILSSGEIGDLAIKDNYEQWVICNGKKRNITKNDGVRGYGSSVLINSALLHLITHIKSNNEDNVYSILSKWIENE